MNTPTNNAVFQSVSEEAINRITENALGNIAQYYGQMPRGDYEKLRSDIELLGIAALKNLALHKPSPSPVSVEEVKLALEAFKRVNVFAETSVKRVSPFMREAVESLMADLRTINRVLAHVAGD